VFGVRLSFGGCRGEPLGRYLVRAGLVTAAANLASIVKNLLRLSHLILYNE
jgi:hypothetical protein